MGRFLERVIAWFAGPFIALGAITAALVAMALTRLNMPGVVVQPNSRPGPSDVIGSVGGTYMVAGITERGETTDVTEVRSISDYVDKLGDRVTYGSLYDDLQVFFAEGGTRALVSRVVGPGATVGTLTLADRAGSPVPTLRIDAANPGAWSTRIKIKVDNGGITNSVNISVLYDNVLVELYANLTSPAAAASAMGGSKYVNVTNLASATVAPNNRPAVLAATALSSGSDDRGSVIASTYTDALGDFGPDEGWGIVAIPGQASSAVGTALMAHCTLYQRLGILATAAGQTVSQAKTAAQVFLDQTGAEGVGLAFPWIKIEDGTGGLRTISPEGYVAAARARAHAQVGPWQAPAGARSRARTLAGPELVLTKADIEDLNTNNVLPIAFIGGAVELYGWRSLSADVRNWRTLTGRDVMNEIAGLGQKALEPYVFGTVDPRGHFFAELEAEMHAILEPMHSAGGLYDKLGADGSIISPAYSIDTGPSVNTDAVLAADTVIVDVALRVSPTGETIVLRITKVAFDSNTI